MKKIYKLPHVFLLCVGLAFFSVSCDDGKVNFFSIDEEISIGEQFTAEILANPEEYPILDPAQYPQAYAYINRIKNDILASDQIRYKDRFQYNVYIIDKDVFNAFAIPGGNTFYYTGLIKFLDDEASLAGVIAHEIAHADRRHSTKRLTSIYGFQMVASLVLGNNPGLIQKVLADLALTTTALSFSRKDEFEADEFAVKYLYPTDIDSRGVAYFFQKIDAEPTPGWMTYFSTHPPDDDRITAVHEVHRKLGGKEGGLHADRYQAFKNLLPQH
jgi:beta-barrel assembly-enhancing protease